MEGLNGRLLEWWVAARTLPGETDCGDRHLVHEVEGGALLAAVDGLGHGEEAAAAAQIAVRTLREHAQEPVVSLVNRCHGALRGTRGAVMSVASFRAREGTMTWIGVGNVEGLLMRPDQHNGSKRVGLVLRGGVVGGHLPTLHVSTFPVRPGDTLVFATDGIGSGFDAELDPKQTLQVLAERIITQHGTGTDDALVLMARFLGGRS